SLASGCYEQSVRRSCDVGRRPGMELVGMEHALRMQIEMRLREKADKPVIAVDFGGMWGVSFLRLAHRFAKEIDSGELVLVVTNLSHHMPEPIEALREHRGFKEALSESEQALVLEQHHRVAWLQADARELLGAKVVLRDGRSIPLHGNVDLVHEFKALM